MDLSIDYKDVGRRLKKLRVENQFTQKEIAIRLGISRGRVSQIESGDTQLNSALARKFATLYGVTIDYLVDFKQEENKLIEKINGIEFSKDEITEISNFIDYIISKRGKCYE